VRQNPSRGVTKYKGRLKSRGFLQRTGIDFGEVFALVLTIETIRMVVTITSLGKCHIYQMDIKQTFLNGPIDEEVYID